MPSQTINLQKRKKNNPQLDGLQRRIFTVLIVLTILLIVSLGAMLVLKKTIVASEEKQEAKIVELSAQVEVLKQTEGLYLTLTSRLETILKYRQKQGFIAELPEILHTALSPYGDITDLSISDGQFQFGISTGRAKDVKLVLQALNEVVASLEMDSKIIADSTDIDDNGNHILKLTVSYAQEQGPVSMPDGIPNGTQSEAGI